MGSVRRLVLVWAAIGPAMIAIAILTAILIDRDIQFIRVRSGEGQGNGTVSLALGLLASCTKTGGANQTCTMQKLNPNYDLSVIPPALRPILEPPGLAPAKPLMAALAFGLLFVVLSAVYSSRGAARFSTGFWVTLLPGLLGPGICLVTFLTLAGWNLKTVIDFNAVNLNPPDGNKLVAELTSSLTVAWVACGLWSFATTTLLFWGKTPDNGHRYIYMG